LWSGEVYTTIGGFVPSKLIFLRTEAGVEVQS
jgi:hypothetical protein